MGEMMIFSRFRNFRLTNTEDLVYMLQRMGYDTGIDFEKLLAAAKYQKSFIDGIYSGHQQNINTKTPPCC